MIDPAELGQTVPLPEWVKNAKRFEKLGVYAAHEIEGTPFNELAITDAGLKNLNTYLGFSSDLTAFIGETLDNGHRFLNSSVLRVPQRHPGILLKRDVAMNSVGTLLTLSGVAAGVPKETEAYVFRPVELYFAARAGRLDVVCMEKMSTLPINNRETYQKLLVAKNVLQREVAHKGITISPTLQDILYLGLDSGQKPIISLVDQADPNYTPRQE